jgi:hypothetical protein
MTLQEKVQRRDYLAKLIAMHKADNAERAEYKALREELKELVK